jgi:aldose 1-epimerase
MKHTRPTPAVFGQFQGDAVHQVTLGRPDGLQAQVMTWGAVLCNLTWSVPDGTRLPLILGFDTFAPYPAHSPYFGAVVGRYANRIAGGCFTHAGQTYHLDRNEGPQTTLHGGSQGFARRIWQMADLTENSVTLALTSPDGDQGFPGTLTATCTYSITDHQLTVQFTATTDRPTPVNLAQHAYFNLDGGPDISDHSLQICADAYTPTGPDQIPTGSILPVAGTIFDFRQPKSLVPLERAFDHNFVLPPRPSTAGPLQPAAQLVSRKSGIRMQVATTKPGLQFYSGNLVNVPVPGHGGRTYGPSAGLCLETQYFPDSPNQPGFPDSILYPANIYAHRTTFSFDRG